MKLELHSIILQLRYDLGLKIIQAEKCTGAGSLIPYSPCIPTQAHHRVTKPEQWRGLPLSPPETPAESAFRLHSGRKNMRLHETKTP